MKNILRNLKELQDIDTQFLRVQRSIKAGPVEEQKAKDALAESQKKLTLKEEESTREKMAVDEQNLELKTVEDEIASLKEKMNTVKNNKEYTIIKDAMSAVNERKESIETVELEHMQSLEDINKELEEIKEETAKAEEELAKIQAEVAEQVKELKKEASALREKRKACAAGCDPEALAEYEVILRESKGMAVAALVNNACQGCFRNVAQNIAVKVKVADELTKCRGCGRFLYDPEILENATEQ